MSFLNKREFVRNELLKVPKAKVGSEMAMICCPFHADDTPSCGVFYKPSNKDPGRFYCFGCQAKGDWNTLARRLNLKEFDPKPHDEFSYSLNMRKEKEESEKYEELIFANLPPNKKWRDIPTNLLIKIGCKICQVDYGNNLSDKFIYLPVYVGKKLKGYTKGRMHKKEGVTSYINERGSWVKSWGLFPFDYSIALMKSIKSRTMVLVEGQRDALRLIKLGIPALCIMGTGNWTDKKRNLLEFYGVKNVILMMDGDDAGIRATNYIVPSLQGYFDKVITVKLWKIKGSPYLQIQDNENPSKYARDIGLDLWDPGNCPKFILEKLKNYL
jgi:5S rRNA maturation endonuclease (ribonuclease M5)|nr:MAG TPA: DNA directed DNA polymerase [Caudoviricetes sp.]